MFLSKNKKNHSRKNRPILHTTNRHKDINADTLPPENLGQSYHLCIGILKQVYKDQYEKFGKSDLFDKDTSLAHRKSTFRTAMIEICVVFI